MYLRVQAFYKSGKLSDNYVVPAGIMSSRWIVSDCEKKKSGEKKRRDYQLCTKRLFLQRKRKTLFFSLFSVDNVHNFVQNSEKMAFFRKKALWITFL